MHSPSKHEKKMLTLFWALMSAPASISKDTISLWPRLAANIVEVSPSYKKYIHKNIHSIFCDIYIYTTILLHTSVFQV